MKFFFAFLMISLLITGCQTIGIKNQSITSNNEPSLGVTKIEEVKLLNFKRLNGYFLKNDVNLPKEVNFFTLNSLKQLNNILGIAKTMGNTIDAANFEKNIAVVIAMKPSQIFNSIAINRIYMKNNEMYIEYTICTDCAQELSYFALSMEVFEIEKPKIITNIHFVNDKNKTIIIPFGNRNINSPSKISDIVDYTGVFKGLVKQSKDKEIAMELNLKADYTYTLKQKYLMTASKAVYESVGIWRISNDLSSFILDSDKNLIFYFLDRNSIEKLDTNGERMKAGSYRLKK